jgi:multiple sugar transport system permease protein
VSTTIPPAPAPLAPARPAKAQLTERARHERNLGWMLAGPAFIVMVAVTGYPILNAVWLSLFDYRLTDPAGREFVGLGNYATILTDGLFWRQFAVTAGITIATVSVELVLGFALALVMHRALKLRRTLRTAILIPYGIITVVARLRLAVRLRPRLGLRQRVVRAG